MSDIELYKPNELISVISEMELTRTARHLFNYFLQHAQREIKFNKDFSPLNYFKINISELNAEAEIVQKNYKLIKQSIRKLMQPVAVTNNKNHITEVVPVTFVDVDLKSGDYVFRLEPLVIDLLKNNDYFTKLNLKEVNPFTSKHSLIIYEYLKQFENAVQIPVMTIDKLRQITDTQNKRAYDNFTNLKDFVLDVATKEINEKTKYHCTYETIKKRAKTRYKVTEIKWTLTLKNNVIDVPVEQQLKHYNQYEDLLKSYQITFVELTIEDVYKADCQYTFDTLVLFARQLEEKQYSPKTNDDFHQWLEDRTVKYKGYDKKDSKIKDCYNCLQSLTRKNNTSNEITGTLPMSLLPPDLIKKDNEPDNNFVIEAKKQYGKFCYRDYIQYMYDMYEANKDPGTLNLIEPFLLKENY